MYQKFFFAHSTSVKYTTRKTPCEILFGTERRKPTSLKLGLYRRKHYFCCADFCKQLPSHSHSENHLKNHLMYDLLLRQFSLSFLDRERGIKQIYSATFERCQEQGTRSHADRKRFEMGQHLDVGQKPFDENHRQKDKSFIIDTLHHSLSLIVSRIQATKNKKATILRLQTVHRNHLFEYYPKEKTLPPMVEENVPMGRRHDDCYERFLEQHTQK